jgi:hypothetical protein
MRLFSSGEKKNKESKNIVTIWLHYFRALFLDCMDSTDMPHFTVLCELTCVNIFGGKVNDHCL